MRSRFFHCGRAMALALVVAGSSTATAQQQERTRLFSDASTSISGNAALSPDGKWLVFPVMQSPSKANLVVTRAGSGQLQALTTTGSWDSNPQWSPSGDRIFFVSDRTARQGTPHYHAMAIGFDPATGRAVGDPSQIGPDPVIGAVRVSPDGKSLAYASAEDRRLLKVVPLSGGEPRVVTRMPLRSANIAWSPDGTHLYFITNTALQDQRVLHRVPAAGGEIVTVSSDLPPLGQLLMGPGAETFAVMANGDGPRDRLFRIYDQQGKLLQTITSNRNTRVVQFTDDGRSLVAVEADIVAPTRIMPIAGGAYRDVTPPVTYDWVMRWSEDGKTLYTWTERDGASVLAAVPVDGGDVRTFPESAEWEAEGANSRYVFQASRRSGSNPRSLSAIDLRDGSRHPVSVTAPGHSMILPYGPGGTWGAHEELYYFEQRGDVLDVKAWRGPGDTRMLASLPASVLGRSTVAVHGNRVLWQQERGDSVDLMIMSSKDAEPRRLLTMPAMVGTNELAFSNDGRHVALHYSRGPGSPDLMAFIDPTGAAPPRIVDTGLSYWYWPRWLPDDSGVLVVGGGSGAEAHIVRIPLAEGASPVNITRSDPASKWGFEVSPDGKYVAYPGEIWKGSSVWRIDLGDGGR